MTEPFRPDDDLVSAVLDGEATEDERARVAADPVLAARLAEFAAAADLVAAPVAPRGAADRDGAITAAVAERRRRDDVVVAMRGAHRQHTQHLLAVAAAVLVVLLAAGFLIAQVGDGTGGGNDTAASGSDDSATDAESASDTVAAEAGDAGDGDAAAFDDTATYDLGAVANDEAVRNALVAAGAVNQSTLSADDRGSDAVTDTTVASVPEAAAVPGGSDDCQIRLEEADPSLDGRLVKASATFAGDPAVVYVFGTADGGRQVTVVSADTCVTLASFPL